jgi:WD40 repeat protein
MDRVGGWDGSLRLFDIVERREGPVATLPEMVFSCAFSRDGSRLVAGCARAVVIWDVDGDTIRERATWPAPDRFVSCALSPDGDWVIAGLENGTFVVWDIDAEAQLRSFEGSPGVTCCALSTDGRRLATGSDPPALTIWDVAAGSRLLELTGHAARVVSCNFSPDARQLVSGSWDQTLRVWDLNEPTDVTVVSGHADQLQDACSRPMGIGCCRLPSMEPRASGTQRRDLARIAALASGLEHPYARTLQTVGTC